jgi:hypothetical protein
MAEPDDLYLVIATRLSAIEAKIDAQGSMRSLIQDALSALALESRNAVEILELKHRVSVLEGRMRTAQSAETIPPPPGNGT